MLAEETKIGTFVCAGYAKPFEKSCRIRHLRCPVEEL